MFFPGSRDECSLVSVDSNYPGREPGEVKVKINGPVYILGVSGASWHYQERESWNIQENPNDPEYPFLSTSSMGGSGLTEDEARDLVKVGCICYDLSKEGLTGAVSACSLPTRSATIKDREHAWSVWVALLKMKNKFPKMKLGISKEDKKFPWE
jgi:hypothetical protein